MVKNGVKSKDWPKIERDGGCLLMAYILIQGDKGNDDDVMRRRRSYHVICSYLILAEINKCYQCLHFVGWGTV